ncbi:Gfo/Idh/MocA family oxidoreductase [Actinoallomurus sp. NBC_01490]|uniref:Gfo/Idh/MocA family protein n=1 Tax=Actinoallomurus sp. NBC_01490 TaxID=2903557 RepID=UPI002E323BC4|nr:Gfo/Idh/MocA family oxidoreductase [Actinoallomurus sp. NBC_01490]
MTHAGRTDRGRRRYALVGTGHRAEMYFAALIGTHRDAGVPVALCDTNRTRMAYYQRLYADAYGGGGEPPAYDTGDFETMLERERPDAVIVATVDATHARYVTAALDRGCDVICEKPLTTDADGCRRIAEAALRSDGELVVTFNYRYSPRNSEVKRLLMEGAIGQVTSVVFEWVLDTVHGADYFRRWHRRKANSGGLLVHKATHHFDLVGWWLDDLPETVFALGALRFYGPDGPVGRARREHGAPPDDPFALDLDASPRLSALYGRAREEDGYVRDGDVFSPDIDIEDNMAVLVRYERGPALAYSLNAHSPWEGYRVAFNGTEGRLELNVCERAAVLPESANDVLGRPRRPALDPSAAPDHTDGEAGCRRPGTELILQRHWSRAERIAIPEGGGAHGGGDDRLLDDVFRDAAPDPLHRRAGFSDGIAGVLVGAAANRSMAEHRAVAIDELGLPRKTYARAPTPT